jgi:serine/threonine protein kinase
LVCLNKLNNNNNNILYRETFQSDIYSAGCSIYKIMMGKFPFDTSDPGLPAQYILKGEYMKIPKENEGGIYSDIFVDLIHSMMDLVFLFA